MKIVANDYLSKEVLRMIREYTGLTQTEFGKKIYRTGRSIRAYPFRELEPVYEAFGAIAQFIKATEVEVYLSSKKALQKSAFTPCKVYFNFS